MVTNTALSKRILFGSQIDEETKMGMKIRIGMRIEMKIEGSIKRL